MQAYRVHAGRGKESLVRVDYRPPVLAEGEVRVRVRAVALNYRDIMIAQVTMPSYTSSTVTY